MPSSTIVAGPDVEVIYQHFENFGEAQAGNVEPRVMSFILRLKRTSRKKVLKTS
jgi:hypothetical protein